MTEDLGFNMDRWYSSFVCSTYARRRKWIFISSSFV